VVLDVYSALWRVVVERMERVVREERERLDRAAEMIVEAVSRNGVLHVVGAGHSAMVAEEMFYRAGGLACVNPIIDTDITVAHGALRSTLLEHVEGYARALLKSARVSEGDVVMVVSTSGVNTFPIEAALAAREMGARTIGITSLEYSKSLEPRNRFGKRLYEVVDVYIDNKVPRGDAVLEIAEGIRVAPVSTMLNAFIVNSIVARAAQIMIEQGIEPAVWLSSHLPNAEKHNERLFKLFGSRIKLL